MRTPGLVVQRVAGVWSSRFVPDGLTLARGSGVVGLGQANGRLAIVLTHRTSNIPWAWFDVVRRQ